MAPQRVLVIEDYKEGLDALAELLGTLGYVVEGTLTGADGLAALVARPPDIVLVDLALPDVEGCELIRRIREAAGDPLIVAYSGYQALRPLARAAGADGFVLKPNVDALLAYLGSAEAPAARHRRRRRDDR